MGDWMQRTRRLIGDEASQQISRAHVAVVGLGGVGGAALWALVRCGVGRFTLIDCDQVDESNLNRQMIATRSTLGLRKTQAAAQMVADINPGAALTLHDTKAAPENITSLVQGADVVADCIDDLPAKAALIEHCLNAGIPIISSMGTGNRRSATSFEICDLAQTSGDGLARALRKRLRKAGIEHLPVVFSKEPPIEVGFDEDGRKTPASIAYVPPSAGFAMAQWVIERITNGV